MDVFNSVINSVKILIYSDFSFFISFSIFL
nr:MAG TPA: hypothetical protein [Caudoviricetes sp.]